MRRKVDITRSGKRELVDVIRFNSRLSTNESEKLANRIYQHFFNELMAGKSVRLTGSCTFRLRPLPQKTWTNKDGKVYKTRKLYRISVDMSAIMRRACAVENPNVAN